MNELVVGGRATEWRRLKALVLDSVWLSPYSVGQRANMARSRNPFFVRTSGAFRSACAWQSDSQFPTRTPWERTPFILAIPDASSGTSSPLSAASTASFRTAVIRTLIEIGPSLRASRATRQAVTVAFVNPAGRGSSIYQTMNSSTPRL